MLNNVYGIVTGLELSFFFVWMATGQKLYLYWFHMFRLQFGHDRISFFICSLNSRLIQFQQDLLFLFLFLFHVNDFFNYFFKKKPSIRTYFKWHLTFWINLRHNAVAKCQFKNIDKKESGFNQISANKFASN